MIQISRTLAAFTAAALVLSACEKPAEQVSEPVQHTSYDARTFFETTSFGLAGARAFSPDGKTVLASSDETGVFNAIALNIDGSATTALTQSDTNATIALSYFPNDSRILYTFDAGGNELNHVFARAENGEAQDLTPGENLKAAFNGWAGDNSAFYLSTTERDGENFDLYRYSASDYERELVFENDGFGLSAISRDGRWLALSKPRTSADSDVYLVDLTTEDKTPQLITAHEGNIAHGVYDFTPDNSKLIYATNEFGEFNQAWAYDLESGTKEEFIADAWDVNFLFFSQSGKYLAYGVNADASTKLHVLDWKSGSAVELPEFPSGEVVSIRFADDDSQIALLLNGSTAPSNIYVSDLTGGAPKALTNALNPAIDQADLVEAEVIRYPSFDGLEIPSILYKPKTASADAQVPAIIWVHGGPGGQSRTNYNPVIQHLTNHGYAVLAVNNRGSSGYGKTFFHMDDKRHGDVDLKDVIYGRRYLEGLDWVDGEKVAIMGGSYGGYMVAAALAFEPEAFDVGVNIFGVTNWVRTLKSIPPWWASFREALYDELGDPATDEERLMAISPLFHAGNIVKPLLVVQGANDPRVLQVESDEIVAAVKANGVPVDYVVFPDEGHGFRKRENRITASEAYLDFLNTHLKGS